MKIKKNYESLAIMFIRLEDEDVIKTSAEVGVQWGSAWPEDWELWGE